MALSPHLNAPHLGFPELNPLFFCEARFGALRIANRRFEAIRVNRSNMKNRDFSLQFPNAVGRRNTQMSAKERNCPQKSANASPQKSAKECTRAQKSAKERFHVKFANNQVKLWELPILCDSIRANFRRESQGHQSFCVHSLADVEPPPPLIILWLSGPLNRNRRYYLSNTPV